MIFKKQLTLAVTVVILQCLVAFPVAAQPGEQESTPQETATSFEHVLLLVKPGDKITVLESSGRISKGKIAELSPSSLRLLVNHTVHDFPAAQIREITQRRGDHLGLTKGIIIGSGIGLGFTILAVASGCGECAGPGLALTGLGAGIGAGIGAALDGVIRHDVTIYRAPRRTSSRLATEKRRETSQDSSN